MTRKIVRREEREPIRIHATRARTFTDQGGAEIEGSSGGGDQGMMMMIGERSGAREDGMIVDRSSGLRLVLFAPLRVLMIFAQGRGEGEQTLCTIFIGSSTQPINRLRCPI
jgi:hypothetical protein